MKNDYNDYRIRTFISQSFDTGRATHPSPDVHALLNKGEKYVLRLYNEGKLQVAWNREGETPTLTMKS
jgi:hypothetical protein